MLDAFLASWTAIVVTVFDSVTQRARQWSLRHLLSPFDGFTAGHTRAEQSNVIPPISVGSGTGTSLAPRWSVAGAMCHGSLPRACGLSETRVATCHGGCLVQHVRSRRHRQPSALRGAGAGVYACFNAGFRETV